MDNHNARKKRYLGGPHGAGPIRRRHAARWLQDKGYRWSTANWRAPAVNGPGGHPSGLVGGR